MQKWIFETALKAAQSTIVAVCTIMATTKIQKKMKKNTKNSNTRKLSRESY